MWSDLQSFYKSDEWTGLLSVLKLQRLNSNNELICEHCGKPIVKKYDCIGHHKEALTLGNVNNADISLNPDNIAFVHFRCHNEIHNRYGTYTRHIYLVYGSPLSGKTGFVLENKTPHDLIIDIDAIYAAVSAEPLYTKSGRLFDNVMAVRDCLLDNVKCRYGKWVNAWIISTMPYKADRERFVTEYSAELIHIDADKDTCLMRLEACTDGRDKAAWRKYIDNYFDRFQE